MLMLYRFSLKHIRVWQDMFSSKRKIIWKASIASIFNKWPKMHENECNLAGDTITLNDDISGVVHCIRFTLFTFFMIKTKACHRHKIISGGCYNSLEKGHIFSIYTGFGVRMNLEFLQTHPFCCRIFIFDQIKSKHVILFYQLASHRAWRQTASNLASSIPFLSLWI